MENSLPSIPAKRYFTISEVSKLCEVKPHVLRYWEQEFAQLRPMKRRGNRRYYQLNEVELIRQIRQLLYEQGFTIVGARNRLHGFLPGSSGERLHSDPLLLEWDSQAKQNGTLSVRRTFPNTTTATKIPANNENFQNPTVAQLSLAAVRRELINIRNLLGPSG